MAGNREWQRDGGCNGRNRARIYFQFNTNNGSNPNTSLILGAGGVVSTITAANTGEHIITLSTRDFYYRVIKAWAGMEGTATGDGQTADVGAITNEAATNSAPISFKVFTYNSSKALANITNRRVWVEIVVEDKGGTSTGDP